MYGEEHSWTDDKGELKAAYEVEGCFQETDWEAMHAARTVTPAVWKRRQDRDLQREGSTSQEQSSSNERAGSTAQDWRPVFQPMIRESDMKKVDHAVKVGVAKALKSEKEMLIDSALENAVNSQISIYLTQ